MDQAHQSMEKMKRKASVLEKTEQLKRLEDEEKAYRQQLDRIEQQEASSNLCDADLQEQLDHNRQVMDKSAPCAPPPFMKTSQFIENVKEMVEENIDDEEAIQRRMQELEEELFRSCDPSYENGSLRHEQLLELKSTLLPVHNDSLR